jgi:WhiB family redox-sensing transcriptional regulator
VVTLADVTLASAVELIAQELGRVEPWQRDALCSEPGYRDADFFPDRGASTGEAKAICARCLVRAECLDYALRAGVRHGVWGGLSEHERRRMRRDRVLAA